MNELIVKSPAFETQAWLPDCNSGFGEDFSPEMHLEGLASNAVSMAITLDDLDHPLQPGYNHWVAWNIPPRTILPAHLPKGAVLDWPFHIEQGIAYGRHCYRGPKPPFNWMHRYCFTVYVLDDMLTLKSTSSKDDVTKAMQGHILQQGALYGKYQRRHK